MVSPSPSNFWSQKFTKIKYTHKREWLFRVNKNTHFPPAVKCPRNITQYKCPTDKKNEQTLNFFVTKGFNVGKGIN
jgi:hypothetical protein